MIEVEFPYYVDFGKMDSVDCVVYVELTEDDYERLVASAKAANRFRLDEDEAITDIYDIVYDAVVEQEKENLRDNEDIVYEYFEDELDDSYDDDEDEDYDEDEEDEVDLEELIDRYIEEMVFDINYPEDLQDIASEEE